MGAANLSTDLAGAGADDLDPESGSQQSDCAFSVPGHRAGAGADPQRIAAAAAGEVQRPARGGNNGNNGTGAESASAAAPGVTQPRDTGGQNQSERRRPRTTEERLAYYREKYGEDFRLAEQPAAAGVAAPTGDPQNGAAQNGTPQNGAAQNGAAQSGAPQPASGLRRLLPRLFGRHSRPRNT